MEYTVNKIMFTLVAVGVLVFPTNTIAHQPRIPEGSQTVVPEPEISKAYYSKLEGEPHSYRISSDKPFALYVNVLVPDIADQNKDVSAAIIMDGKTNVPLTVLDGTNFNWQKFHEPFGNDNYWQGPEFKQDVPAGNYEIRVWSSNNNSKYSLAIGEREAFDLKETINAIRLIPKIKREFFDEATAGFILSPFGLGYVAVMYILAFVFGFVYRLLMKRVAISSLRGLGKNIGFTDRWLRVAIGLVLFIVAIITTWNAILLFLSGFCFFEAIFSWCGLYAIIGRNNCPID